MLKKMKNPELYINYGVWVFLPNSNELVKRKIIGLKVGYTWSDGFYVESVCVLHVGWLSPEEVYMTRNEAFSEGIKLLRSQVNELKKDMERHKRDMEMSMKYQLGQWENSLACRTQELKKVLESEDRYLKKKGVGEEERAQIKFFRESGFERIDYERVKKW